MHQISNTTINNIHMYGNNTIMQGSVTVIMINEPVSNVPATQIINDNNILAISVDLSRINNHFGDTPIRGVEQTHPKGNAVYRYDEGFQIYG